MSRAGFFLNEAVILLLKGLVKGVGRALVVTVDLEEEEGGGFETVTLADPETVTLADDHSFQLERPVAGVYMVLLFHFVGDASHPLLAGSLYFFFCSFSVVFLFCPYIVA